MLHFIFLSGNRIKRDCPAGMHFSRKVRNCVDPSIAGCEERKWACPKVDKPGNWVFLPSKEDCEAYYVCFNGEPWPMVCTGGLHWSIKEERCMAPEEAGCEEMDDDGEEECPDEGIKSISHPNNCEKFVLCVK
jgi:hypothetical protein